MKQKPREAKKKGAVSALFLGMLRGGFSRNCSNIVIRSGAELVFSSRRIPERIDRHAGDTRADQHGSYPFPLLSERLCYTVQVGRPTGQYGDPKGWENMIELRVWGIRTEYRTALLCTHVSRSAWMIV